MSNNDPLGPRIDAGLFGRIMESLQGRNAINGRTARAKQRDKEEANRWCKYCTTTWFEGGEFRNKDLMPAVCTACQAEVDSGRICLASPDKRIAWVYSKVLAEGPQYLEISNELMDKVEARAKEQQGNEQ